MSRFKRYFKTLAVLPLAVFLISCSAEDQAELENIVTRDPIDRKADLTRNEAEAAIRPHRPKAKEEGAQDISNVAVKDIPIPPLSAVVLAPDAPEINNEKRISLTVTDTIELRDVLLELARLAELELALDPNIKGGIILSVKNRKVGEVLEMVSDLADLKYSVDNGVLKVSRDLPYLVNYSVDYLNIKRNSKGSIDTKTQAGSSGGGGGGSSSSSSSGGSSSGGSSSSGGGGGGSSSNSFNSGSSNQIDTETDGDLWGSIEKNVDTILKSQFANLAINDDEQASTANTSSSGTQASTGGGRAGASSYSINKQAGIISVMTTYRRHKAIKEYLDMVMSSMSAQVLIEAKVLEVSLNDSYASGIDWTLARGKFATGAHFPFTLSSNSGTFLDNTVFTGVLGSSSSIGFSHSTNDVLSFLNGFGLTRTLSNPRITIQNNQQAVLTFAKNEAYFTLSVTSGSTTSAGGTSTTNPTTITSSLETIPIGVILALQPSVNLESQEVTLHIRPTLTSKVGEVEDPAVKINAIALAGTNNNALSQQIAALTSKVPVVQVRELDTVLKAKSGDVMVIGGLIQHVDNNADVGVPFLSSIPLLGNAVKKVEKKTSVVETVILMTAKIITPRSNYHPQDKKLYDTFTQDPRPFAF